MPEPPGWYSRGYLSHYDDGAKVQLVTYRLADALPTDVIARFEEQALADERRRAEIERWLDAGHGSCALRHPENATAVVAGWRHFEGVRYLLHAWVVMPNHVHVLIAPLGGWFLSQMVHSWKSYTAKRIVSGSAGILPATSFRAAGTAALPRQRRIWQPDYWDRFIRNERHYRAAVDYIHENPVKARLVSHAEDWPWSSAAVLGARPSRLQ